MKTKRELGIFGEEKACSYLKRKHYQILERNFWIRNGEIDLIARDGEELVFIEVKTRTGTQFGNPADAVDRFKQAHLITAAQTYIHRNGLYDIPARFDVVEVMTEGKGLFSKTRIKHIKNAFMLN